MESEPTCLDQGQSLWRPRSSPGSVSAWALPRAPAWAAQGACATEQQDECSYRGQNYGQELG